MKKLFVFFFITLTFFGLSALATVQGHVCNQESLEPLPEVIIEVSTESSTPGIWEEVLMTETDENGWYSFEVEPGEYHVFFFIATPIFGLNNYNVTLEEGQVFEQDVYIQDVGVASWDNGFVYELDANSGEQIPLADVQVFVDDELEPSAISDIIGNFGISGILGETYNWIFIKTGYETTELEITAGYNQFSIEMSPLVINEEDEVNQASLQLRNYPNPFKLAAAGRGPGTTISFSTELFKQDEQTGIYIYNSRGQKIRSLVPPFDSAQGDIASVNWNGNDQSGNSVSSGIYYYALKINGRTEAVSKCLLLK